MTETTVTEESQAVPAEQTQETYYHYPGSAQPPSNRGSNLGCWLIGLVTAFVVTLLIAAGLFLPPFNLGERIFGPQFVMLSAGSNAVQENGLTLIVDPADTGTEFGVDLDSVPVNDFLAGSNAHGDWIPAASQAVEPYLALQSPVYTIETTGKAPGTVTITIVPPPSAASLDVLDLYAWDAPNWKFVPAQFTGDGQILARFDELPEHLAVFQASPNAPIILTHLDNGQQMAAAASEVANIVTPAGMQAALPTGSIRTLTGNPVGTDLNASYQVMPVVRNFTDPRATDPDTIVRLIGNRELRDEHVSELTAFASAGGYDGLFIDYRDLPAESRENFTAFIRALGHSLNTANLTLGVVVPPAENVAGGWDTGAYHWRSIGKYADLVQINFGIEPTTFSPGTDRLVEAMLRWAVGEISRYKLIGGLSALSVRQTPDGYTRIGFDDAVAGLGDVQLDVQTNNTGRVEPGSPINIGLDGFNAIPGVDTSIQTPFIEYRGEDDSFISRMWLTTGNALRYRMDRLAAFGIAGVGFTDLLNTGVVEDLYASIANYKVQLPSNAAPDDLVLNWRIESIEGAVTEFTTEFNEDVVVTLNAPDGNYAVNVDVVSGGVASSRGGAAVALFAPTVTPTPVPTNTPLPTPTVTPTLEAIVPTATTDPASLPADSPPQAAQPPAAPQGNFVPPAAVAPGAGSISLTGFEYGGHVTNSDSERAINAMRGAGMTWMKVQLPWGPGGGTEAAQQHINNARANGFKILLGVVGNPNDLERLRDVYIRQYADFLGAVASLGPDAIEVWNEPNLSREWPEGQIDGGYYAQLLRASYETIKFVNPSVIVISAAPAPTGAEAAFPGRVVNDDNWLRQLVQAGGLNYLDCVGMHYNEGLVSPYSTSGDPRDNYYTRYLPTLLDVYWGIVGGQRPICVTELGYLTPEGYGQLPDFFAWAGNMTVANQAAWLAEAAAYLSNSGKARMMIVWNVDFENFGADPMGGYAIVRPGGACPACTTLSGAR